LRSSYDIAILVRSESEEKIINQFEKCFFFLGVNKTKNVNVNSKPLQLLLFAMAIVSGSYLASEPAKHHFAALLKCCGPNSYFFWNSKKQRCFSTWFSDPRLKG
jgi:hypothetical protein